MDQCPIPLMIADTDPEILPEKVSVIPETDSNVAIDWDYHHSVHQSDVEMVARKRYAMAPGQWIAKKWLDERFLLLLPYQAVAVLRSHNLPNIAVIAE